MSDIDIKELRKMFPQDEKDVAITDAIKIISRIVEEKKQLESAIAAKDEEIKRLKESAWTEEDVELYAHYKDGQWRTDEYAEDPKTWLMNYRAKRTKAVDGTT